MVQSNEGPYDGDTRNSVPWSALDVAEQTAGETEAVGAQVKRDGDDQTWGGAREGGGAVATWPSGGGPVDRVSTA